MPVCRPVGMSVIARGTGWKPRLFHHSTILWSPAQVKIFIRCRSSTLVMGSLLKKWAQPP